MNYPAVGLAIATIMVAFSFTKTAVTAEEEHPPNIILCMGDDHGWDETAYNGHPHLKTPVLDEMAATGLRMDRFYSASPVCSPTRGSVLTGRHPNRYGTFAPNWSIRPEEISIAQILSEAGYACGHFGKWHLGAVKAESPINPGGMGFHSWLSHDNFFEIDPYLSRDGGAPQLFRGESSDVVIEAAIEFIGDAQQAQQPFLAVVWFGSPHEPYSGLPEDLALYKDLPKQYEERMVTLTSMKTGLPVKRSLRDVLQERYAEITAMDRAIGKLRRYLADQQLRGNTIVWYCGDNGVPRSGRITTPFRGQKADVYEGGVRVPSVMEWPNRIRDPRATSVNTVTSDILPTICELVGRPLPDRPLDGISLKRLIEDQMPSRPTPICFWNYDVSREAATHGDPYIDPVLQDGTTPLVKKMNGRATRSFRNFHHPVISAADFAGPRAILDNRYKLVIDAAAEGGPPRELFDLTNDPAETKNLVDEEPNIVAELEQQLSDWQNSVLHSLTGADY